MKQSFRQSMSWLHTWSGLLPGWLLFAIFLFGTTAFFQSEISAWMRPELRSGGTTSGALGKAHAYLNRAAPDAIQWNIAVPGGHRPEAISVSWISQKNGSRQIGESLLDGETGRKIVVRDTRGGNFLYRFHFDLHYLPVLWSRIIVSAAALAMLVAILSGIVTHKKIFVDFFVLRFKKGQRSWLDAHNVTAVLALPFHLMITYTGLVTLLFTLMPWAIAANFRDVDAFYTMMHSAGPEQHASGKPAPLLPLEDLAGRAASIWGPAGPGAIAISNPGDAAAVVTLWPRDDAISRSSDAVYLSGVSGRILHAPQYQGAGSATQNVMIDVHAGRFSDPADQSR